ncbi:MAG: metallophosphoesterase [Nevskiaceae bacterium]|nr:MAG: metallophosphoesterase [Nevskiaceae bacterium]TBR71443.1 MAG: metallophosphoesterase [Nevskiaceae bacterium]
MMVTVSALLWGWVMARGVVPLRLPRRAAWLLGAALLALAEYHVALRVLSGPPGYPTQPRVVLLGLAWAFGALVMFALALVLRDGLGLLLGRNKRLAGCHSLAGGLLVAASIISGCGVTQAVRVPAVKTVEVRVPNLPAAFDGYRIVQVSDLHISNLLDARWLAAVVARVNAAQPDLVAITGDFQDGTPARLGPSLQPLEDLRAPDGVFGVPGNHEYYGDFSGWMRVLRGYGVTLLQNAHVEIRRGTAALVIAGVTDPQAERAGRPVPDIPAALAGVPAGVPVVLLSHHPTLAADAARAGVALMLAGHTHGGQIPGLDLLTKTLNDGFLSGLYNVNGMPLYVSSGTGLWAGFALRIGHPSEITVLTLRR